MKKNSKINKKLIIIFSLILISLILMYFSTENKNVKINYKYFNEVNFSNQNNYNLNVKIGEINIINNNFLPSKIYLKNLIVCNNEQTYFVEFINSKIEKKQIFNNYDQKKFVEINKNSNETFSIIFKNLVDKPYLENSKKIKLNSTKKIYLFENKNLDNYYNYNFCQDVKLKNSIKEIKIIN